MPASSLLVSGRCEFHTSCPWSLWLGPTPTSVWFLRGFYFCCFLRERSQAKRGLAAQQSHMRWIPRGRPQWRAFGGSASRRVDLDDMHQFRGALDWQGWRHTRRLGHEKQKRWPLHDKVLAAGPAYGSLAQKVRSALKQIDRVLDVFEPGQLALSFNGSKDDTVLLHLFIEACAHHPTHRFDRIQPVWFRDPMHEFPEIADYIQATAKAHFMFPLDLRQSSTPGLHDETTANDCRLWTMQVGGSQGFMDAVIHLSQETAIRCLILGNRHTDTGCRDLTPISVMDLAPIVLSGSMSRMTLEAKLNMLRFDSTADPGLPGTHTSKVREPSLLRFVPPIAPSK